MMVEGVNTKTVEFMHLKDAYTSWRINYLAIMNHVLFSSDSEIIFPV